MTELQQGANAPLPSSHVRLVLTWQPAVLPNYDLDASAFLLTANGQVRGDHDMVFYNQPRTEDGAMTFESNRAGQAEFVLDTARLSSAVERIAFTLTLDNAKVRGQSFGDLQQVRLSVSDARSGAEAIGYTVDCSGRTEAALIVGEVYRRNDQVKVRAVGQGYDGGLEPLARSFGVEVEAPTPTPTPVPTPKPDRTSESPPAPSRKTPPETPPLEKPSPKAAPQEKPSSGRGGNVNLSKITLDKRGQSVSLGKKVAGGSVTINLNWSQDSAPAPSGMFGGLFGGGKRGVDLDLGCLWELQNGQKGIVQALGKAFGNLRNEPYIALSGDDRSGSVAAGETITVSGEHWAKIRRIAVYAYIYEGVPNWSAIDGVVTVRIPEQPPIEVKMDEPSGLGTCGIILIENNAGDFKVTRMVEYFQSQRELDQRLGWGLRWVAGRKD